MTKISRTQINNFPQRIYLRSFYLADKKKVSKVLKFLFNTISPFLTTLLIVFIRISIADNITTTPYILFLLVILFHAFIGKGYSGIIATIATTLAGNYFFMEPSYQFKFYMSEYALPTIEHFGQGLILTFITVRYYQNNLNLRKINQNLTRSKEQFDLISGRVFTLFVIATKEGTVIEVNKTYSELLTAPEKELLGKPLYNCFPWATNEDTRDRLKDAIDNISSRRTIQYEDILMITHEKNINVEVNVTLINRDKENPFLIISIIDISERKQNEKRAIREQLMYTNLINSNIIGIMFANRDRKITKANKRFLNMIDYNMSEIKSKSLDLISFVPEPYHQIKRETINKIVKKGYGGPIEIEMSHKNGTLVPVLLSGVLVDPEKQDYIFLIVDLSEQKRLERKKDEFISIAGHELKTPLTIIKGYLQMMTMNFEKDDYKKFPLYLSVLNREISKLNDLLNELLDISKIETNKLLLSKSEFNLIDLLNSTRQSLKPFIGSKELILETTYQEINIFADYNRISQVLINLITNAVKHSPRKGKVIIRTILSKNSVKVEVQDFGKGIHKEKMKKIFEKFFQIERNGSNLEGLGLGLYISKEIIKIHNGHIGVKSEYGKGSTFFFSLPLGKQKK